MALTRLNAGPRMSQAALIGDVAFLAGQIASDLTGDIAAQTGEVLAKIDAILAELGSSKSEIASVQIWLADMSDFQAMNAVWDAWIDPENPPARAAGGVALARPGVLVEMIAVARVPGK